MFLWLVFFCKLWANLEKNDITYLEWIGKPYAENDRNNNLLFEGGKKQKKKT